MDEKILIKSEMNPKTKIALSIVTSALSVITLIFVLLLCIPYEHNESYRYLGEWFYYTQSRSGFSYAFDNTAYSLHDKCLTFFILACVFFALSIVSLLVLLATRKCELTITEKNVRGKTLWGKEVILPLYMVSAYSTRKFLSTITVSTSSGITKFTSIKNCAEIGKILSEKINERQDSTIASATSQNNSMDDIAKLKALLDQGIVTQEEFDAKKKQILGLQ